MSGVLVDTCIWSHAFRGGAAYHDITQELMSLIDSYQAKMIGPIRQELLSGYSNKQAFDQLRNRLLHFPNLLIIDSDYETAGEYANLCRTQGIQGSHTDFLICAVAVRAKLKIYTVDRDFQYYANVLPVKLYQAQSH